MCRKERQKGSGGNGDQRLFSGQEGAANRDVQVCHRKELFATICLYF